MSANIARTVFLVVMVATSLVVFACDNPRESTSNTGTERSDLPSPVTSTTSAPAGSNTSNANYANTLTQEESFWTIAADSGMAQVEMAKLSIQKAQSAEVKKFAQMMIADHTKSNNELKAIAAKQKIPLPTEIGPRHRSTLDELGRLAGADFDREYVQAMVDNHEADIQLFEDQAEIGSDEHTQAFATKALPALRTHLEAIKGIQSKLR